MTDVSDEDAELWERARQASRDPYSDEKEEVLQFIEDLPEPYSTTEALLEHLQRDKGLRQGEVAGVLLEMKMEELVEFQAVGEDILVYLSEQGRSVVDHN